jgi:kynureninase
MQLQRQIAGAFVHERHAQADMPRFNGWWGHRQDTRFKMGSDFKGTPGAEGWQLSNPPIFAMAPLRASLEIFHRAGMPNLRRKSLQLTAYLDALIEQELGRNSAAASYPCRYWPGVSKGAACSISSARSTSSATGASRT